MSRDIWNKSLMIILVPATLTQEGVYLFIHEKWNRRVSGGIEKQICDLDTPLTLWKNPTPILICD